MCRRFQGVLLLIESLQHDPSSSVRAACARGLSSPVVGARAARVLLLALQDRNAEVSHTVVLGPLHAANVSWPAGCFKCFLSLSQHWYEGRACRDSKAQ
jgi:hypothetical protein